MSPITLSVEALALLRRRLTQGDRRVDDSNREAYRELARAGIVCPVSGYSTGPESHYRFTAKGWRRRGEFLDGSASPARSTREDIAMPTITLSAEAVALLRLHLERDGIRVDDSNREPTGSWPAPGSCTRSPATPPDRSRTTASPRKAGGAARNSSVAPPPLAIPVPDRPRQLPRRRGDRQLRIRRPLHGLVVGIAAALLVFAGDHAVHAGAQPRLLPGRIRLPPQWGLQVRVEYPGVELDAAPRAEAPAGLVEGIERAPGDAVLMVAQADPLQGDAELFHPHGGILVQLVPPLKRELGGVLNRVGRDLHAEGKARRLAEEPA